MTRNELPDELTPDEPTPDEPKYLLVRRWVLRMLIGGILFGFCAFAVIVIWLIQIVDQFHSRGLQDRTDIACTFVQPYPDTAGPGIKALREKYRCPPFRPPATPITRPPGGSR